MSPGLRILLGMILGGGAGAIAGERAAVVQPLGDVFLRLLLMAAIPLVFFNLVAGLTSMPDLRALGRLAWRLMAYYVSTTVLALTLSLVAMHLLQPGRGMQLTDEVPEDLGRAPDAVQVLVELVPDNVVQAFASGRVAQVVVFAILFGVAALRLPEARRRALAEAVSVIAETFRKLVDLVLLVGPIGIGALAAVTVGQYGSRIAGPLALFLVGIWSAQAAMFLVYLLLLRLFTAWRPAAFLRATAPLAATAAATCSSLASLVVAFEVAEKRLRIPRAVYAFTLPLGAQINKDGTAIMLAGVLLFTAQAAGVDFDLPTQLLVIALGLVLSEGTGGIPGSGLVVALIFVRAFNLPLEIGAIVAGIYRLIDTGATTINVMGDMVGTCIVSRAHATAEPEGSLEPAES